jgi:hypothetical protein
VYVLRNLRKKLKKIQDYIIRIVIHVKRNCMDEVALEKEAGSLNSSNDKRKTCVVLADLNLHILVN